MTVPPRHGAMCSRIGAACVSFHCRWCGEPTSSQGHDCPEKIGLDDLPTALGLLPDEGQIGQAVAAVSAALLLGVEPAVRILLQDALTHLAGSEMP